MTDERLPLAELLEKAGDGDFLRAVAEAVLQLLMEADVEGLIGAARHERTAERQTYRGRALETRPGRARGQPGRPRPALGRRRVSGGGGDSAPVRVQGEGVIGPTV